ncbi:hypothetical protein QQ045_019038 [Rhodiola kirilowii]
MEVLPEMLLGDFSMFAFLEMKSAAQFASRLVKETDQFRRADNNVYKSEYQEDSEASFFELKLMAWTRYLMSVSKIACSIWRFLAIIIPSRKARPSQSIALSQRCRYFDTMASTQPVESRIITPKS